MQSSYSDSNKDKIRKFRKERDDYHDRQHEKKKQKYFDEKRKQKRNEGWE